MILLVFDIDGTILNSTKVDEECYYKAMTKAFGIDFNMVNWELFKDVTDQGLTEDIVYQQLSRSATKEEVAEVEKHMGILIHEAHKQHPEYFKKASGIENIIQEIQSSEEVKMCFATGAWRESALVKLSCLESDISKVPLAHAGPLRRRADIVNWAVTQVKHDSGIKDFERVIALGDGLWDMNTAAELGLEFIGVDLNENGRLKEKGCQKVIREYLNLKQLVS